MTQKAKGPDAGNVRANREITLAGERDSRKSRKLGPKASRGQRNRKARFGGRPILIRVVRPPRGLADHVLDRTSGFLVENVNVEGTARVRISVLIASGQMRPHISS